MTQSATSVEALDDRFLRDYPREAATELETLPAETVTAVLQRQPVLVLRRIWEYLTPGAAVALLPCLSTARAQRLLTELEPTRSAGLLMRLDSEAREWYLALLDAAVADELRRLLEYPPGSAGALMDARPVALHGERTAGQTLAHLRAQRPRSLRFVFVVDDEARLVAAVDIKDLALADPTQTLSELATPVAATVSPFDPGDELTDTLNRYRLEELPVVDVHGRLWGVIHARTLMRAVQEDTTADVQTMVGASRDERALSSVAFAVRKRLPWMEINLATAFLAAAVVGLFEDTIARFTALAVLLPVVAGQSGNAGAQALAVTMRGLALREISLRHSLQVTFKELRVGLFNGVAIAATTAAGVYVWSASFGLALVIALAMVISMIVAGMAGALVPMLLTRFGQDPAQSSSIVLTTVTDIAGFMSFLGIATLLAALL